MSNNLIREHTSGALINTDYKSLEDYKFKKNIMKDINNLKSICELVLVLENRIDLLEKKIEELKNCKD